MPVLQFKIFEVDIVYSTIQLPPWIGNYVIMAHLKLKVHRLYGFLNKT